MYSDLFEINTIFNFMVEILFLIWSKISNVTLFDTFSFENIVALSFIAFNNQDHDNQLVETYNNDVEPEILEDAGSGSSNNVQVTSRPVFHSKKGKYVQRLINQPRLRHGVVKNLSDNEMVKVEYFIDKKMTDKDRDDLGKD